MKYQSGVSLSEVLISLFLATLMMTALTQFYLSAKRQYLDVQDTLDKHFDLQWVGDLLSDSLRRAGFTPCLPLNQLMTRDMRDTPIHLSAYDNIEVYGEAVQINRMSEYFSRIVAIPGARNLFVAKEGGFNAQHPVIIADCRHAEIHQIASVQEQEHEILVTLNRPLLYSYDKEAYIGAFLEERWFIKPNKKGTKALYYSLYQTEEVTPLVHSLQATYEHHLMHVRLGLDKEAVKQFTVAVRG